MKSLNGSKKSKKKSRKITKKSILIRKKPLPKKDLEKWLSQRSFWNHNDWLNLLSDLKDKGYHDLVASQEGKNQIGEFLEANRNIYN